MTLTVVKTTALTGTITNAQLAGGIDLTAKVTGTLPIANGGTNSTATTFVNATTNVTGALPIANGGTGATSFSPGKVLQVIQGTLAGVVTTTSINWSATGLSASITPSATSSKILVSVTLNSCYQTTANKGAYTTIFRDIGGGGYSNIAPGSSGDAFYHYFGTNYSAGSGQTVTQSYEILDTVNTTSAVTYKVYFETDTSSQLNVNQNGTTSYIVLQEIGA